MFQTLHRNVVVNGVPVNGMMSGFINGVQFAFDNDSDIDDYELNTNMLLNCLVWTVITTLFCVAVAAMP